MKANPQFQEKLIEFCPETLVDWSQVRDIVHKQEHLPKAVKSYLVEARTINERWGDLP